MLQDVGIVAIGRNEGERLRRCLASSADLARILVYADSASTDESVEAARGFGIEVVELDPSRPLNAARGRNAGMQRLFERAPDVAYVFFVDGDCQVVPGFLEAARAALEADPGLGAACGRRREVHPEASIYNRLVDAEWNTPVGEAMACGGDVLVRAAALREIGGYDESMSCGEDPEMSFRLRAAGWRILRLGHDMTLHDVALEHFGAWWRRHARGGYAFAHGAWRHFHGPEWFQLGDVASILGWGLLLPLATAGTVVFGGPAGILLLSLYGVLAIRVWRWRRRRGDGVRSAAIHAAFLVIGKLAETTGVLRFLLGTLTGRGGGAPDYKDQQRTEIGSPSPPPPRRR
ncbi:MAG: glycosyltransferase family 2 protein [Planctomycetota bacterium]